MTYGPPGALAVPPGKPGDIAFDSLRTGSWDLFVMAADGTRERRLDGNSGAADARPSWAPDIGIDFLARLNPSSGNPGDNVAVDFGSAVPLTSTLAATRVWFGTVQATARLEQGQYVVTVPVNATSGAVCLEAVPATGLNRLVSRVRIGDFTVPGTVPESSSAYCPSQPIAFQSNRTGNWDLWMVDPAPVAEGGGAVLRLLNLPGSNETAPAWSPGPASNFGTPGPDPLIAFESDRAGTRDIWVLDPSRPVSIGTNPSRLTSGPSADANPDWSPDGKSIAFERSYRGRKEIWIVDVLPNGSGYAAANLRRATIDQPPSFEPSWSWFDPGEFDTATYEQIAFSGPDLGGTCELNYLEQRGTPGFLDPSLTAALTYDTPGREDSPAYSPLGDQLLFHNNRAGSDDVYMLQVGGDPDGPELPLAAPVRLTESGAADRHPSWQALWMAADVGYRRIWGKRFRRKLPPERIAAVAPPSLAASDCQPPNTRITAGPGSSVRAAFRFRATEAGSRFRCKLDKRPWRKCKPGVRFTVRAGKHTFRVRAIDRVGNPDPTPAVRRWRR